MSPALPVWLAVLAAVIVGGWPSRAERQYAQSVRARRRAARLLARCQPVCGWCGRAHATATCPDGPRRAA